MKKKRTNNEQLTEEQKEMVIRHFKGPFKPEWFDKDGILDNRDKVIAKRLGVGYAQVEKITREIFK